MSNLLVAYLPIDVPHNIVVDPNSLEHFTISIHHLYDRFIHKRKNEIDTGADTENEQIESLSELLVLGHTMRLKDVFVSILKSHSVRSDTWSPTRDTFRYQVLAVLKVKDIDKVIRDLTSFGFGKIQDTSLCLLQTVYSEHYNDQKAEIDKIAHESNNEFMKSIRARMTIAEVINGVTQNAQITFDSLMLLIVAGILAGTGLIFSDPIAIVASMLVSPLMGPIMAMAFGFILHDKQLVYIGFRNEAIYFSVCIVLGFSMGILTALININGAIFGMNTSWPTITMWERGELKSLVGSVIVALVSGIGVALSLMGGNISSLVGVAISASLLPPIINCGIFFGHTLIWSFYSPIRSTNLDPLSGCLSLLNNKYSPIYNCSLSLETLILACISLAIYFINVTCIFLSSMIMLKIKQINPLVFSNTASDKFFKKDLKYLREHVKGGSYGQMGLFGKEWLEQYMSLNTKRDKKIFIEKWRKIINQLESEPDMANFYRNFPNYQMMAKLLRQNDDIDYIVIKMYRNLEKQEGKNAKKNPAQAARKFILSYKAADTKKLKKELIDNLLTFNRLYGEMQTNPIMQELMTILKESDNLDVDIDNMYKRHFLKRPSLKMKA